VPDPLSLLRLVALVVFIALVAVGLWLLDVAWWVVPPVMLGALLIAWTIEWLAWRGAMTSSVVLETEVSATVPPPAPEEEPVPVPLPPLAAPEPVAASPPVPEPPAESEPAPSPAPEPPSEPPPAPAPEPEPEPLPPEPVVEEETVVAPPETEPEPVPPPRRARRFRLRSVQAERPEPEPEPAVPPPPTQVSSVVEFRPRTAEPRQWNLWDLERIAREEAVDYPERRDEWSYLFLNLRQFARADGSLPAEFDPLVRESFGGLLERTPGG
jgi:outer membrane biosynthesis protein TonB